MRSGTGGHHHQVPAPQAAPACHHATQHHSNIVRLPLPPLPPRCTATCSAPPAAASLLCTYAGTGIQLFGMTLVTMVFALLGFLSPANRGGLTTAMLMMFVFMGLFAGYFAARLYKSFRGEVRGGEGRSANSCEGVGGKGRGLAATWGKQGMRGADNTGEGSSEARG